MKAKISRTRALGSPHNESTQTAELWIEFAGCALAGRSIRGAALSADAMVKEFKTRFKSVNSPHGFPMWTEKRSATPADVVTFHKPQAVQSGAKTFYAYEVFDNGSQRPLCVSTSNDRSEFVRLARRAFRHGSRIRVIGHDNQYLNAHPAINALWPRKKGLRHYVREGDYGYLLSWGTTK